MINHKSTQAWLSQTDTQTVEAYTKVERHAVRCEGESQAEGPDVQHRATGEQPGRGGHHRHATVTVGPPSSQRFDRERDQTRDANEETDIRLAATQMLDVERQRRKEKEEAEEVSQCDEAQEDEITGEEGRAVVGKGRRRLIDKN